MMIQFLNKLLSIENAIKNSKFYYLKIMKISLSRQKEQTNFSDEETPKSISKPNC